MNAPENMHDAVLKIINLSVFMRKITKDDEVQISRNVYLTLRQGEIHALVGESGCGKTVTSLAVLGLLNPQKFRVRGTVQFENDNLLALNEKQLTNIRGSKIAIIFQEPRKYLNPSRKIASQLAETVRLHNAELSGRDVQEKVSELLMSVGLEDVERVRKAYPHELSGGMCQRIMIAQALAGNPQILIADEPTTALDANHRAEIELLIREKSRSRGIAVLFISHDLQSVARIADRISVMYAGRIVEQLSLIEFINRPRHPYTHLLQLAVPDAAKRGHALEDIPGVMPDPAAIPSGCAFHDRCPWCVRECAESIPLLRTVAPEHTVACHRQEELWQHW